MPIQPKPYKLKCPKCGYSYIHKPKSDAIDAFPPIVCPKCNTKLERVKMNMLDELFGMMKS